MSHFNKGYKSNLTYGMLQQVEVNPEIPKKSEVTTVQQTKILNRRTHRDFNFFGND